MITFNSLDKYSTACLCIKAIFNDKFNSKFPQRTVTAQTSIFIEV